MNISAEAETPILWPPDVKNWLIWKDSDAGKDWRQEEKGMIEDEMVGWHHWLDGHEFEQARGLGDGQRSLLCCSPWDCKGSDMSEWLNWAEEYLIHIYFFKLGFIDKAKSQRQKVQTSLSGSGFVQIMVST